jgi:hypothetical protein
MGCFVTNIRRRRGQWRKIVIERKSVAMAENPGDPGVCADGYPVLPVKL